MLSTPRSIISSKKRRTLLGSAPSNNVVLVVTRKPPASAALIPFTASIVAALAAHRKIVVFTFAIHVNGKAEVLAGLEEVELLFQQQRVCAEVNVLLPRYQAFYNLADLRMHQRLAARDGDHGRAALVHRPEALFRGKLPFQHVCRVLDFSAACAS